MQKISIKVDNKFDFFKRYFGAIAALNNISLTKREMDLICFTAINRDISSGGKKEEFIKKYGSSTQTIFNMLPILKKKGFFTTLNKKVVINPKLITTLDNIEINVRIETSSNDES
jgi:hypothetical protein